MSMTQLILMLYILEMVIQPPFFTDFCFEQKPVMINKILRDMRIRDKTVCSVVVVKRTDELLGSDNCA